MHGYTLKKYKIFIASTFVAYVLNLGRDNKKQSSKSWGYKIRNSLKINHDMFLETKTIKVVFYKFSSCIDSIFTYVGY